MSMVASAHGGVRAPVRASALLAVLGIVYGDIGTSPLYAFKASLDHFTSQGVAEFEVLGILSLIFWSLIVIVTLKYVVLVMRADNKGEGGILALMALAQRATSDGRGRTVLTMVGIIGACLFFGDGIITPAVSVLSAVEGLEVSAPNLQPYVVPISCAIIVGPVRRAVSRHRQGRPRVRPGHGGLVRGARRHGRPPDRADPHVLLALSPHYLVLFCIRHGWLAFVALGSVVLAVTGAEALYADMGHFGAAPIRRAWMGYVLPCLVLNYFGQGALILNHPSAIANPFFLMAPPNLRLPLVVLATAATVIASQALISGAYSIARQCMQMNFLPRMTVTHTSTTEEGQIYVPQVNTALFIGVLLLVLAFRSSDALTAAYGIAVTGTFICTCILAAFAFRRRFGWSRPLAVGVFGSFFVVDCVFFAANLLKVPEGGWVPLVIGLFLMALMTSWKRGRDLLLTRWKQDSLPLASFLKRLPQSRTVRVPGMAVFLTGTPDYVPAALLHNLKHNKVLHEKVLFVTVSNLDVPEVRPPSADQVTELAPGIHRVILSYGFMESPNIPRALEDLVNQGVDYDPMQASYFLGREVLVRAQVPKLPLWRLWLFLVMVRNAVPGHRVLPHPQRPGRRTGRPRRDLDGRQRRHRPALAHGIAAGMPDGEGDDGAGAGPGLSGRQPGGPHAPAGHRSRRRDIWMRPPGRRARAPGARRGSARTIRPDGRAGEDRGRLGAARPRQRGRPALQLRRPDHPARGDRAGLPPRWRRHALPHRGGRPGLTPPTLGGLGPQEAALAFLRFAFLSPARASTRRAGAALNRTVAPAFTATFSPVFGFNAVRFGVSRSVNEPNSGRLKRPAVTISVLMAPMISAARWAEATPVISVERWMTSVMNFFDMETK